MLVDGFNDLHGFRASVPDDGEFDGVMGFAVPVLHVSVKESRIMREDRMMRF